MSSALSALARGAPVTVAAGLDPAEPDPIETRRGSGYAIAISVAVVPPLQLEAS